MHQAFTCLRVVKEIHEESVGGMRYIHHEGTVVSSEKLSVEKNIWP